MAATLRACGWHASCAAKMDCCGSPLCENPFAQARHNFGDRFEGKSSWTRGPHRAQENAPLQQLKKALAL